MNRKTSVDAIAAIRYDGETTAALSAASFAMRRLSAFMYGFGACAAYEGGAKAAAPFPEPGASGAPAETDAVYGKLPEGAVYDAAGASLQGAALCAFGSASAFPETFCAANASSFGASAEAVISPSGAGGHSPEKLSRISASAERTSSALSSKFPIASALLPGAAFSAELSHTSASAALTETAGVSLSAA